MSAPQESLIFWQHDVPQTLPNDAWTPLLLNTARTSRPNQNAWTDYKFKPASTTTTAGGVLPLATISVTSTADFASSGYLAVRIGATDRVVKYTGKTATTFTGCTLGVGTLVGGETVRQGVVEFKSPYPALCAATAEVGFAGNITGRRGIRFNANLLGIFGGGQLLPAVVNAPVKIQTTEQPAFTLNAVPNFVEVFQDSGGTLDTTVAAQDFGSPRLVVVTLSTITAS